MQASYATFHNGCRLTIPADDGYEHLPPITAVDGLVNLISACLQGILLNVLDPRTYDRQQSLINGQDSQLYQERNVNGIPSNDRYTYVYARGAAIKLLDWYFNTYEFVDNFSRLPFNPRSAICRPLMAQQCLGIVQYRARYDRRAMYIGIPGADITSIRQEFGSCLKLLPDVMDKIQELERGLETARIQSLVHPISRAFTIGIKSNPTFSGRLAKHDHVAEFLLNLELDTAPFAAGISEYDDLFINAL